MAVAAGARAGFLRRRGKYLQSPRTSTLDHAQSSPTAYHRNVSACAGQRVVRYHCARPATGYECAAVYACALLDRRLHVARAPTRTARDRTVHVRSSATAIALRRAAATTDRTGQHRLAAMDGTRRRSSLALATATIVDRHAALGCRSVQSSPVLTPLGICLSSSQYRFAACAAVGGLYCTHGANGLSDVPFYVVVGGLRY